MSKSSKKIQNDRIKNHFFIHFELLFLIQFLDKKCSSHLKMMYCNLEFPNEFLLSQNRKKFLPFRIFLENQKSLSIEVFPLLFAFFQIREMKHFWFDMKPMDLLDMKHLSNFVSLRFFRSLPDPLFLSPFLICMESF